MATRGKERQSRQFVCPSSRKCLLTYWGLAPQPQPQPRRRRKQGRAAPLLIGHLITPAPRAGSPASGVWQARLYVSRYQYMYLQVSCRCLALPSNRLWRFSRTHARTRHNLIIGRTAFNHPASSAVAASANPVAHDQTRTLLAPLLRKQFGRHTRQATTWPKPYLVVQTAHVPSSVSPLCVIITSVGANKNRVDKGGGD